MADEFKPGDVVQLKAGGIVMIVVEGANGQVSCEWLDDEQNRHQRSFAVTSLKHFEEASLR
jgi:uncharacterized protein YodC (DUF2158 family)